MNDKRQDFLSFQCKNAKIDFLVSVEYDAHQNKRSDFGSIFLKKEQEKIVITSALASKMGKIKKNIPYFLK